MYIALALLSSAIWGSADYLGGVLSRRTPAVAVVAASQTAGLLFVLVVALASGAFGDPTGYLPWAVGAGLSGLAGLLCYYTALATGAAGVVAPIASLGVVVPVVIGFARGESPSALQVIGIAAAGAGIVLTSGPERAATGGRRPLLLAAVAAVGFGLSLTCIAYGSRSSTVMTLVSMRVITVLLLATAFLVVLRPLARNAAATATPRALLLVAAVGIGDALANLTFGVASSGGYVSVVGALASLYPVATVLLARGFDHERLRPVQLWGVATAFTGIALISAG